MKIASILHHGERRTAVVTEDAAVVLRPGLRPVDLAALPAAERDGVVASSAELELPLTEIILQTPVLPAAFRDFVSFERHVEGAARAVEGKAAVPARWFEGPTFLMMNPHGAIGSGEEVVIPPGAVDMDYELEVAAVIGHDGRNVTPDEAADLIVAYTICNDWSARDLQSDEMRMGLGPAKGKDFATTLGPWLVTVDELEPYRNGDRLDLEMSVSVNGTENGRDRLANMAWSFEVLVAYAARGAWVKRGDVICSGTCQGGALAELWGRSGEKIPPPLVAGDTVTMTVDGLGTIENTLVAGPPEAFPIPPARRIG